nr:hypothetical protein [Planococcus salinarum]
MEVSAPISAKAAAKLPITQCPLLKRPNAIKDVKMVKIAMTAARQPTPAALALSGAVSPFVEDTVLIFSSQSAMGIAPFIPKKSGWIN